MGGFPPWTALDENTIVRALSNDLIRMFLNTREDTETEVKDKIIDDYSTKLRTSGFEIDQVRRLIVAGIKGYERKLAKSKLSGRKTIHRSAKESQGLRRRTKLLGKSSWFRKRRTGTETNPEGGPRPGRGQKRKHQEDQSDPARTVLFVEQTNGGD